MANPKKMLWISKNRMCIMWVSHIFKEVLNLQQVVKKIPSMPKKNEKDDEKAAGDRHAPHKPVRIPMSLYERLKAIAAKYQRPVTWQIRIALESFADSEEDGKTS